MTRVVEREMTANGRHIVGKQTEVSITGEAGRFIFVQRVTAIHEQTGEATLAGVTFPVYRASSWIDVFGGKRNKEKMRSFEPGRIRTVHRLKRTR